MILDALAPAHVHDPAPWRVLIVDDSRDDAELAELALRDAGIDVDCRRASSARELHAALLEFAPHVMLSDVNIPGFSGAEALALARAHDPALPVVFLTGSLFPGEEPPQAEGLLLKDALGDLPGEVRRLLRGPTVSAGSAAA